MPIQMFAPSNMSHRKIVGGLLCFLACLLFVNWNQSSEKGQVYRGSLRRTCPKLLRGPYKDSANYIPISEPASLDGKFSNAEFLSDFFITGYNLTKLVHAFCLCIRSLHNHWQMMKHGWNGYRKHAWGADHLKALTGQPATETGGTSLAMTMIGSLDTLLLMGMHEEYEEAVEYLIERHTFDKVHTCK